MSGLRWRIARLLDRSPRTCWADLVSWAQDGRDGRDYTTGYLNNHGQSCRTESACHRDKACWCNKFRDGKSPAVGILRKPRRTP